MIRDGFEDVLLDLASKGDLRIETLNRSSSGEVEDWALTFSAKTPYDLASEHVEISVQAPTLREGVKSLNRLVKNLDI